jgi:putative acyl-CoA dehydrogenase
MASMKATHEVTNQSTPFVDRNLYAIDAALQQGVARLGAGWAEAELTALGAQLGSAKVAEWARLANTFPPQLRNFDRSGRRIDEVEFHPAWHEVMRLMIGAGVHADPWATRREHRLRAPRSTCCFRRSKTARSVPSR